MSNPAISSLNISNASIPTQARRKRRKNPMMKVFFVVLAFVSFLGIGLSFHLIIKGIQENKIAAMQEQENAFALQPLSATRAIVEDVVQDKKEDNNIAIVNLYSKPSGASVYFNGFYIGDTPINEKKMEKSTQGVEVVMVKEHHEIARRTINLNEEMVSETLTLNEITMPSPGSASAAHKPVVQEGVVANKAVVITNTPKPAGNKNKSNAKKAAKPAEPADMGIVLPD